MAIRKNGGINEAPQAEKATPAVGTGKPERPYGCWPFTDEDRAIVAMRETKTLHETAAAFNVTVSHVLRSEWIARRDAEGRELLAQDPENLNGLALIGELSNSVADALRYKGKMERLSDLVAAGQRHVLYLPSMGAKRRTELEAFLSRRDIVLGDPKPDESSPAGPMGDAWNVLDFPTGNRRLEQMTRNTVIRARWFSLSREISSFQNLLCEAVGEKNHYNATFNAVHAGMAFCSTCWPMSAS